MGDIVRKHGRYIVAEGRKNDLINRGGEKISTDEINDGGARGLTVIADSRKRRSYLEPRHGSGLLRSQ